MFSLWTHQNTFILKKRKKRAERESCPGSTCQSTSLQWSSVLFLDPPYFPQSLWVRGWSFMHCLSPHTVVYIFRMCSPSSFRFFLSGHVQWLNHIQTLYRSNVPVGIIQLHCTFKTSESFLRLFEPTYGALVWPLCCMVRVCFFPWG